MMDWEGTEEVFYDVDEEQQNTLPSVNAASASNTGELYALHRAAYENDIARLSALLQQVPASEHTLQDPHGNNPLHIAALRGNTAAVQVLLDAGVDPKAKSRRGWSPLHEALAARAMPAAKLLLQKMQEADKAAVRAQREQLIETMKSMPDYSLQLKWSIGSSFPGLSLLLKKIAPHDTYTIWKKGDKLRVDGQLIGIETKNLMPAWKRGHFSILLDGSPEGRAAAAAAAAEALAEAEKKKQQKGKQQQSSRRTLYLQQPQEQQSQQQQVTEETTSAAEKQVEPGSASTSSDGGSSSDPGKQQQQQQFFDPDEPDPSSSNNSSSSSRSSSTRGSSSSGSYSGRTPVTVRSSPAAAAAAAAPGPPRLLFVRHFKESYIDLSADLSPYDLEGDEREQRLEDELMMRMEIGVGKGRFKTRDFNFSPMRGWLGGDLTEKVEGWKCTVYEATGKLIMLSKSKARLHLSKDATFYDYLSAEYAEDEVTEELIDPLSVEGVSAMSSKEGSSHSRKSRKNGDGTSYGGGEMFGEADPDYSEMVWDEKSNKKSKSSSRRSKSGSGGGGEAGGSGKDGRVMRAKCWMAKDFPMQLTQLLPLLNVISTANRHMEKVSKFLSKYSQMDVFPVKLQVPLLLTVYVLVSFKAFHPLLPNTSDPPPDEAFFAVPTHYKRRRLEDALDKAAMGVMRMGPGGKGDGYGADENFFYGGDAGEDMMLAELDKMMAEEEQAVEGQLEGLTVDDCDAVPGQGGAGAAAAGADSSSTADNRQSWGSDCSPSDSKADSPVSARTSAGEGSARPVDSKRENPSAVLEVGGGAEDPLAHKAPVLRESSRGVIGSRLDKDIEEYANQSSKITGRSF